MWGTFEEELWARFDLLKDSTLRRHCPNFNKSIHYKIIKKNLRGSGIGFKVSLNELMWARLWEALDMRLLMGLGCSSQRSH